MYTCKHFIVQELVDKFTYEKFGELSWQFFDPHSLIMIDGIRDYFNSPVYINNWDMGGENQYRGLRASYVNIGATFSLHKFGKAFDMTVKGLDADYVRKCIMDNKDDGRLVNINRLEGDVTWLHADTANIPERIMLWHP